MDVVRDQLCRATADSVVGPGNAIRDARTRAFKVVPKTTPGPTDAWTEDHWAFVTEPRK